MSEQWYVICTHQSKETWAKENLENQEFATYLPMCWSAWSNKPRIRPLLPGYIFARADMAVTEKARKLWSTRGVSTVLCSGQHPSPVPDYMIEEIKGREVDGLVQLKPKMRSPFARGDVVRLKGSPLDAVFEEPIDNHRASVFISLLNRTQRLVVPLARLASGGSQLRAAVR